MKHITISARARSRFRSSLVWLSLLLFFALANGCNLRENALLPPDLDPKLYVRSNLIKVYKDHLIKSDNDDAYLYIRKESIADFGLWYGDIVRLRKVENLTNRDSLAFAQGTQPLTDAYKISIERSGATLMLDSIPNFGYLYTDLKTTKGLSGAYVVREQYLLDADRWEVGTYSQSRCFFPVDGAGDFELQDPGPGVQFTITNHGCDVELLQYTGARKLQIWFPQEYLAGAQTVSLTLQDSLEESDLTRLQTIYPDFALNTRVINLNTSGQPGATPLPVLHWELESSREFSPEWIRLNNGSVFAWQQGNNTWLLQNSELVSFFTGSGKYFLLSPVNSQTLLELPLDGSFSQLHLQNLWLDLRDQEMPSTVLRLNLSPVSSDIIETYFTGSPYTLGSAYQGLKLEFIQSGTMWETFPNDAWIELGMRTALSSLSQARLCRVYRSSQSDHIDFKVLGNSYDENHFSVVDDYVYYGVSSAGTYILGHVTESSQTQTFPCLKQDSVFQTSRGYLSWNDPALSVGSLQLDYNPNLPSGHPWLSGQPYQFTAPNALLKLSSFTRNRTRSATLPANTFLHLQHPNALHNVVNFSPDPAYPRFVWYKDAEVLEHNSFLYRDGALQISPAFPGYLFNAGAVNNSNSVNLRLYPRMQFDNYDWEYYADAAQAPGGMPILQISRMLTVPDNYGVLSGQYQLSTLGPAYSFTVTGSTDFYQNQLPYIRLRQSSRPQNLLFSLYEGEYYRVYPYEQSSTDDTWHFTYANGHIGFYLAGNAIYAPFVDNAPHLMVNTTVSTATRDHIVSLYQAQLTLPGELISTVVPLNSRIILQKAVNFTAPIPPLNAYFLDFRSAAGVQINPQFYDQEQFAVLPYLYVPIPAFIHGQNYRLFHRGLDGSLTEFEFVQAFSADATSEFIMVGNCAVGLIDGPGWYYVTN